MPRAGPEPEYKDARVHHQTLAPAPLDLSLPELQSPHLSSGKRKAQKGVTGMKMESQWGLGHDDDVQASAFSEFPTFVVHPFSGLAQAE